MASYKDARVLNPWRLRLLGLLDSLGTGRALERPESHGADRLVVQRAQLGLRLGHPVQDLPAPAGQCDPGAVDVIVTTTDYVEFPWERDLEIIPLGADPVVLVLPPDHPLARRRVVDLAACAEETWACDRPGSYMAELTRRLCHESGFEPRVACRFANYLLLLQHVESGRSVALLPALAVARSHAVVTRELTTPVHRNVAVVVRRGSAPRAAVDAVVEALLDHPVIPALVADDADQGAEPRSRVT
jgi:DNA-binding transcriptional LysR family regulator